MKQFYDRQTCVNGHIASNYLGSGFETPQKFCTKCGAETIVNCPVCGTPQQGAPVDFAAVFNGPPDAYCRNCGKPYPWTESQLEAASELVKEEDQLSDDDKAVLTKSLPDLMAETPRTTLAATRFKRILGKAGPSFKDAMYKFVVDFSSETAKKIVTGN
jgi:hypothetical protein